MLNRITKFIIGFVSSFFRAMGMRACRFEPNCSHYAIKAFDQFSWIQAMQMTFERLGRCHPFHDGGYDPLPVKKDLKV